jgi:branched-chain amino acid transport system permease protein
MLEVWLQITVFGLIVGCLYALAASGLALLFQVTEIINIAHGDLIIVGSYVTYSVSSSLHLDPLLSIIPTAAVMFAVGVILQQTVFRKTIGKAGRAETTILVSFGLMLLLENILAMTLTARIRFIRADYASPSSVLQIGPIRVLSIFVLTALVATLMMIILHIYLSRSYVGRAMRATGQSRETATIIGIPTSLIYIVTFGLSTALAGIAGALYGMMYTFQPYSGFLLGFKAFVIILLGGFRSLRAILAAGLVLGVVESIAGYILPAMYRPAVAFVFLIIALLYRREIGALE